MCKSLEFRLQQSLRMVHSYKERKLNASVAVIDELISFVEWINLIVSMAVGVRVKEYLMERLFFVVILQNLVIASWSLRFLVKLLTRWCNEQLWPGEGHTHVSFVVFLDFAVLKESVAHLVQVTPQFVIDEEIKVALVQLCQLTLGEEVRRHLLG